MLNVEKMTIIEIQKLLETEEITSRDLTLEYLKRITEIDNGEIKYNSVLEINPDALNIAEALDIERKQGKVRGLMHGIPVLLKDNINTFDKMHTTVGSVALKDNYANYDAFITKTLREEGAIILGKTNLTEFACFMTFNNRNGYSSHGGYVLCPWDITKDPSGSSTGSAVSVSLSLAPVAIGTETGGSIMSPSMLNGVVGLKPTIGFVSRTGIVPISSTLDTAGPMGKHVTDVAILLSSIRGNDGSDPVTLTKKNEFVDYTKYLSLEGIKGKRIGIDRHRYADLSDKRKNAMENVIEVFKASGAEIITDLHIEQTKEIFHVMKYEFKRNMNHYLSTLGTNTKMKSLKDIIEYNRKNEKIALKYGQLLLEETEENTSGRMNEPEYLSAIKERQEATIKLEKVFHENNLDLIYFSAYTSLGPHCGFPTITIPLGLDEEKMPIGAYMLAPKYREDTLIEIAYALEQKINVNLNPLKK